MLSHATTQDDRLTLYAVLSTEEIEYLVRESQVLTGKPSRVFVVAGADRLFYRLTQHEGCFKVQRFDIGGEVLHSQDLLTFELLDHSLAEAVHAGQLYAAPPNVTL